MSKQANLKRKFLQNEYGLSDKEERQREKKAKITAEELSEYEMHKNQTQEKGLNKLLESVVRKMKGLKSFFL